MTRALGFLTGVCLTAAVFVLVLDRWQHGKSEEATRAAVTSDAQAVDAMPAAVEAVSLDAEIASANARLAASPDGSVDAESSVAGLIETATVMTDSTTPFPNPIIEDESGPSSLSALQPSVEQRTAAEMQTMKTRAEGTGGSTPNDAGRQDAGNSDAIRSHIFWSPFRSEWAARGFAGRLGSATQLTIDVVEMGPGRYRAAFDYRGENERVERIKRIESITGLQLE
jgi:hypothetical protein